jgi:hypothetical protein
MPNNKYQESEVVTTQGPEKLVQDAMSAFTTLKQFVGEFEHFKQGNAYSQVNENEDDEYEEDDDEMDDEDDEDEYEEDDDEDDEDDEDDDEPSYYGRKKQKSPKSNCGCGGRKRRCKCGCGCGCKKPRPKPQYPCECRECDQLKAKAWCKVELAIYALKDALEAAEPKLLDAGEFLEDATKYFVWAKRCAIKHNCKCYCKSRKRGSRG